MPVDRLRVGVGLQGDQFQVPAVWKTDQRHFGGMVTVGAAVDGPDAHGGKIGLHFFEAGSGHRDMIDFQAGGEKQRGQQRN